MWAVAIMCASCRITGTEMKITGQYSVGGEFQSFAEPVEVVQFGDTLRDADPYCGMVWAVKDEYGDWVSPGMKSMGLKSNMEVTDQT